MKLHIFGASGSGVTTLGERLSETLHIPYFDSDDYFWEKSDPPFTIRRDPSIRNLIIQEKLKETDDWILGGSVINWGEIFPDFSLVVFLWLPPAVRLERLKKREFKRYGELIFLDTNRKNKFEEFITWAEDYDNCTGIANRNVKAHEKWLNKINCSVLELRGDLTVEERQRMILDKVNLKL